MLLLLPGIILIGTGIGSLLRQVSHHAQEQVSRAMAVANEAISNLRTVRAFAMEYKEIGLILFVSNHLKYLFDSMFLFRYPFTQRKANNF